MDKDKFNKEINKMFQNKKFVNCLIVLLAIIFLWLAVSNFLGDDIGISKGSDTPQGAQEVSTDDGLMTSKELLNYEDQQKAELEKILSKMSGVGEVIVNIYFESGEIQVLKHLRRKKRIQMEVQELQSKRQKVQLWL